MTEGILVNTGTQLVCNVCSRVWDTDESFYAGDKCPVNCEGHDEMNAPELAMDEAIIPPEKRSYIVERTIIQDVRVKAISAEDAEQVAIETQDELDWNTDRSEYTCIGTESMDKDDAEN